MGDNLKNFKAIEGSKDLCIHGNFLGQCESCGFEDSTISDKEKIGELDETDKRNLLESSRILIKKLLDDYPEKLPDAIIIPDTSGRPIAYLLMPILERIAELRSVAMPKIYFMKTSTEDYAESAISLWGRMYNTSTPSANVDAYEQELKRRESKADSDPSYKFRPERYDYSLLERCRQSLPSIERAHELESERADEIKKSVGDHNLQLVIIDDYATEDATTINRIRQSFNITMPAYVLIGQNETGPGMDNVFRAMDDPYKKPDEPHGVSKGFLYRRKERRHAIGVDKITDNDSKYVVSNDATYEEKGNLRKDMEEIGLTLAAECDKNYEGYLM